MKQIKELKLDELKQIYKKHVKEDFPRGERRPYSSMEKMTNAGKYISFSYYDDDSLLAYACYILTENIRTGKEPRKDLLKGLRKKKTGDR